MLFKFKKVKNLFYEIKINIMSFYTTRFNGGDYFDVFIDGSEIEIYKYMDEILLLKINFNELKIGNSEESDRTRELGTYGEYYNGNTILVETNNNYIFIGDRILEMERREDEIIEFYSSEVLNNDVPYPILKTNKRICFLGEMKMIESDEIYKADYDYLYENEIESEDLEYKILF